VELRIAQQPSTNASQHVAAIVEAMLEMFMALLPLNTVWRRLCVIMGVSKNYIWFQEGGMGTKGNIRIDSVLRKVRSLIKLGLPILAATLGLILVSGILENPAKYQIDPGLNEIVLDFCWSAEQNYSCKHHCETTLVELRIPQQPSTNASQHVAPRLT
jgi:hypothetical protein